MSLSYCLVAWFTLAHVVMAASFHIPTDPVSCSLDIHIPDCLISNCAYGNLEHILICSI